MAKRAIKHRMTPADFRRIALSMPGAIEASHMGHPDFRAGKIFATLGPPGNVWAMVKLTPEQQQDFIADAPEVFAPVKGGWGRCGATNVTLEAAGEDLLEGAIRCAWMNATTAQPKAAKPKAAKPKRS